MNRADFDKIFEDNKERFIEDWKAFLRHSSISADPNHSDSCEKCAEWLASHLASIGLSSEVLKTTSKPCVFASYQGDPKLPTVLFYGHYDVQPVDPIEDWTTPPFEPSLRGERLFARGAEDNKGQVTYMVKAIETLIKKGALKCNLKMIIEGEEECGSEALEENLAHWKDKLSSDLLLVCDTEGHADRVPAITMGLRGIVHLGVRVHGSRFDLHSGINGGVAPNPATQLAKLLATLHHEDGSVAVKGFYDSVTPIDERESKLAKSVPFDTELYERETGVKPVGGEKGLSPQERRGLRPTIEINGIHSGYGGPGHKTIIPAIAEAKVTSRLVSGQDPVKIIALIEKHLYEHAPEGLRTEVVDQGVGGAAVSLKASSKLVEKAVKVLEDAIGKPPVYSWSGASIPIIAHLAGVLKAEPLLVGFGLPEDRIHAPNESFSITQFKDGFLYGCLMLQELSRP